MGGCRGAQAGASSPPATHERRPWPISKAQLMRSCSARGGGGEGLRSAPRRQQLGHATPAPGTGEESPKRHWGCRDGWQHGSLEMPRSGAAARHAGDNVRSQGDRSLAGVSRSSTEAAPSPGLPRRAASAPRPATPGSASPASAFMSEEELSTLFPAKTRAPCRDVL